MRRGEIRWYPFSSPDKKRPVLLLTRDSVLQYLGEVTVAPITARIRDLPSEVLLTSVGWTKSDRPFCSRSVLEGNWLSASSHALGSKQPME